MAPFPDYDVVIVGSGVGGLVCGNYLVKQGLRTLIAEQHYFIGGCCSFYRRHGFVFDVGVHYLGCLRDGGFMRRVLGELGVLERLEIRRIDPTDLVIFPDRRVYLWNDHERTLAELQEQFPHEAHALRKWFVLLCEEDLLVLAAKTRGCSFRQLLDAHFTDHRLKAVFITFLGNLGLPSSHLAGIAGLILFRDYLLDGGYYPIGGTHRFPEVLRQRFEEQGGELRTRCAVAHIDVRGGQVRGVRLQNGTEIACRAVVSNADARQTFLRLIGLEQTPVAIRRALGRLTASVSAFIVYLGLRKSETPVGDCSNIWICRTYDIDRVYYQNFVRREVNVEDFLFCSFPSVTEPNLAPPGYETAHLLVLAPTKDEAYWNAHQKTYSQRMIELAKQVRPNIEKDVVIREPATPFTVERYTRNLGGSIYGWASLSDPWNSDELNELPEQTGIEGLYLAGHWVTKPTGQGGLTMVTYAGRRAAQLIVKRLTRGTVTLDEATGNHTIVANDDPHRLISGSCEEAQK